MEHTSKKIISIRWIIAIICLWLTAIIFVDVLKNSTWILDYPIYNFISQFRNDGLTFISIVLARLGGRAGLAILCFTFSLISLIKYKNKKVAALIIINMILIGAINFRLKNTIQRPRPNQIQMMEVAGFSFPSGHSMGAMGFWGLLIIVANYYIKDTKKKKIIITILSLIILSIGISRIYLGVHYASDVVCGFLITIIYFCVMMPVIKKLLNEKNLSNIKITEQNKK